MLSKIPNFLSSRYLRPPKKFCNNLKMATSEKCLICENTPRRRGLCDLHYGRFVRARNEIPQERQAGFEAMLIEKKLLLPVQPSGPKVDKDEFAEAAAEYVGRSPINSNSPKELLEGYRDTPGRTDQDAEQIAEKLAAEAKKLTAKRKNKSPTPKPKPQSKDNPA
jgi:hypothetical protein